MGKTLHLAIIEDDTRYAHHLAEYFSLKGWKIEAMTSNYSEFLKLGHFVEKEINVVVLDINLEDGESGLDGIVPIKNKLPESDIVILTSHDDSVYIFKALCSGATGFLTKGMSLEQISESILQVSNGGSAMTPSIARKVVNYFSTNVQSGTELDVLTPREYEIVEGIKDGLSYKMIAERYFISIETVRYHVKNIYKKLQVNSKSEVVNLYFKNRR